MAQCSFCGVDIAFGTGKMYVRKDAKILHFCSRRCEKNLLKLKRNPRSLGFTEAARQAKRQRMAQIHHEAEQKAETGPVQKAKPVQKAAKKAVKKAAKKVKKAPAAPGEE